MIKEFHESQNISPISDFTNTTTDTRTTLSVIIRLYNGSTSLGETVWNVTTTGIQAMYSVVVSSTPITRIYIKHNGSRLDIPILDINVDFPNGQFWFTANYISINPTVAGGIQLSNMMLNRGSSALPYEPYGDTWNTKSYVKSISGAQTYTKFPIVLHTTEQSIPRWSVKGNMQQSGTPTPTSPITPSECGERTENIITNRITGVAINNSGVVQNASGYDLLYGKVEPNKTYTIQLISSTIACVIGYFTQEPVVNGVTYDGSRIIINFNDEPTPTVTIPTGVNYIAIRVNSGKDVMVNEGSTIKPYEPYGYKLPIVSGNTTTNIYLSEPLRKINTYYDQLTHTGLLLRGIKKLVLTGDENFDYYSVAQGSLFRLTLNNSPVKSQLSEMARCSHYEVVIATNRTNMTLSGILTVGSNVTTMDFINNDYNNATEFKAHLAAQYAAGTPVTVWYVLATPLPQSATTSAIPTTSGLNTIDVATSLKPSEMSLTYDGYKLCKGQRYSRTENLFDKGGSTDSVYINSSGIITYNDAWSVSDYISVESLTSYTISRITDQPTTAACHAFYDANKSLISTIQAEVSTQTFETPTNTKYIRCSWRSATIQQVMLNTGSTAKPYQPYLDWK